MKLDCMQNNRCTYLLVTFSHSHSAESTDSLNNGTWYGIWNEPTVLPYVLAYDSQIAFFWMHSKNVPWHKHCLHAFSKPSLCFEKFKFSLVMKCFLILSRSASEPWTTVFHISWCWHSHHLGVVIIWRKTSSNFAFWLIFNGK